MTDLTAPTQQGGIGSEVARSAIGRTRWLLSVTLLAVVGVCSVARGGVNEWTSGGPGGGDISSVAIDPARPEIVYAGTLGGVFKSGDAGASWRATGLTGAAVAALAIDPMDTATLYAGTRDGVVKSTDGGGTWMAPALHGVGIEVLLIDPTDSRTVYAGGFDSRVFKSTDAGATWRPSSAGLPDSFNLFALALDPRAPSTLYAGGGDNDFPLRRSTDGGRTWQGVALPPYHCCIVFSVAIDAETPTTIYAGAADGLLRSEDGGEHWSEIGPALAQAEFIDLIIDPVTPTTLYALAEESGPRGRVRGFFKSLDRGDTWQATGLTGLGFREFRAVAIDRTAATLYASVGSGLVQSTDAATSWVATGLPSGGVADVAVDPSQPTRLYAATVGGVFHSTDRGASLLTTGLRDATQQIVVDPVTPATLYAVARSTIVKTVDDGATWSTVNDGIPAQHHVFTLVIDPVSSHVLYVATTAGVFKTVDGAAHWTLANEGITYTLDSLAIAPSDPRTLYGGTYRQGVFATNDGAASWRHTALGYGFVVDVVVDPVDPNTVYADYGGGYKSTDGGRTWQGAAFPSAIDPSDPGTLYSGLSKSTDGGATFSPLPPLPLDDVYAFINALVVDPSEPARLYAATYAGVYTLQQVDTVPTGTPTTTPTPTATSVPTPFVLGLSLDPPRTRVGDRVTLRFSVDVFGSPQFALDGATPLLVFESAPITEAQTPGTVSFTLRAAAAGTAELRLKASYEFFECNPDCRIERVGMTSQSFPLEIGAARGSNGGGCAVDPTPPYVATPLALLFLPVALSPFLRRVRRGRSRPRRCGQSL